MPGMNNQFTFLFYSKIIIIFFQFVSVHSPELQKHNGDQRCKWKAPWLDPVPGSNDHGSRLGRILRILDFKYILLQSSSIGGGLQYRKIQIQVLRLFPGKKGQIARVPRWRGNRGRRSRGGGGSKWCYGRLTKMERKCEIQYFYLFSCTHIKFMLLFCFVNLYFLKLVLFKKERIKDILKVIWIE